jgi:hypothetical protein
MSASGQCLILKIIYSFYSKTTYINNNMKTLSIAIDTTSLNHIRSDQTQIIRRAYVKAKKGLEFKTIHKLLQPTDLDGHLHRCGIQRGIDLAKIDTKTIFGGNG